MDARRDKGKAAARGKVKAVIVEVEATVNEAGNQCNKYISYYIESIFTN